MEQKPGGLVSPFKHLSVNASEEYLIHCRNLTHNCKKDLTKKKMAIIIKRRTWR